MTWQRVWHILCAWNKIGIVLINTTFSDMGQFPETKKQHFYEKIYVIEFQ